MSILSADTARAVAPSSIAKPKSLHAVWQRVVQFVVRRRVALSIFLFGTLIVEDLVAGVVPHNIFDFSDPKSVAGLLCVLGGVALRSWAAGFLIKNSELTTSGPYALVRNPLYLGSFLMVVGFCLLIDDPENLWIGGAFLALVYLPKIRSEERLLSQMYPDKWPTYAAATPRLIPRRLLMPRVSGWRLSQWLRSREYNAMLASAAALWGTTLVRYLHR